MAGEVSTGSGIRARPVGSTVLVTGATGFVGKTVPARMIELDCFATALILVRAADRGEAQRRLRGEVPASEALAGLAVAPLLSEGRIRAVAGDLRDGGPAPGAEPAWGRSRP